MTVAVVKDISAGLIGVLSVLALAAISLAELKAGKPFTEPGSLTALAMASLAYFYGRAAGETATQTQNASQAMVKQIQNGHEVKT